MTNDSKRVWSLVRSCNSLWNFGVVLIISVECSSNLVCKQVSLLAHEWQSTSEEAVFMVTSRLRILIHKWSFGNTIFNDLQWPSRSVTCCSLSNEIFRTFVQQVDEISTDTARCAVYVCDSWASCKCCGSRYRRLRCPSKHSVLLINRTLSIVSQVITKSQSTRHHTCHVKFSRKRNGLVLGTCSVSLLTAFRSTNSLCA